MCADTLPPVSAGDPMTKLAIRLLATLAVVLLPLTGGAQMTGTSVDLSTAAVGAAPPGFEFGRTGQGRPGQWLVAEDGTAAHGRAIAQTNGDTTDYRFPLAIWQGASAKNVEVTLRFKPVGGKVDQAAGIAVRLASPDNYYVVRANALEDNVRFYRVVKGRREQLAGVNTKVASGQWHALGLRAEGDRFTISFDGKQLYTATDATFAEAGRIALWTKADSITHFDDIRIQQLP
jgi:hypothetical protein